jgi:hypothetical protein
MGYVFRGFLTKSPKAAEAALRLWPLCEAKYEQEQMDGFIIRCPNEDDLHPTEGEDAYDKVLEQIEEVKAGLQSLSAEFPNEVFVYIEVTCFGGTCTNSGFHVRSSRIVATFDEAPNEADITEILRPMNIAFGQDQYFKPFTRGYFERDKLKAWNRVETSKQARQEDTAEVKSIQKSAPKRWWQFWQL